MARGRDRRARPRGPEPVPRWGDGTAVTGACRSAGLTGIVLKAHEGSTVEAAAALTATHPPLRVAGGVVLNRFVGGINVKAVEVAIALGARCVWLPTIDADDHVRVYGATGRYDAQPGGARAGEPVRVLDGDGALLPAVVEVLELARDAGVGVATGHAGAPAIEQLTAAAQRLGFEQLLVQHPCFSTPGLSDDQIHAAVRTGALVELTYLSVSPRWAATTLERCAAVFAAAGADAVIVSSDAGQRDSPAPPDALRWFAQSLHEHGVPAADLRRALTDNPARWLGW
jgi:hypothetical protein